MKKCELTGDSRGFLVLKDIGLPVSEGVRDIS